MMRRRVLRRALEVVPNSVKLWQVKPTPIPTPNTPTPSPTPSPTLTPTPSPDPNPGPTPLLAAHAARQLARVLCHGSDRRRLPFV